MSKINIFDLDYTLLNTPELRKFLSAIFELSDEEFAKQEKEWFKDRGRHYNPMDHLQLLEDNSLIKSIKKTELAKKLKVFLLNIDECFFEGSKELLQALKARGDKLVLISLGNAEWQQLKLENSKILRENFDDLLIEESDKLSHKFFQTINAMDKEFVVYNDKLDEGMKMKHYIEALGGRCRLIIIKGPYSTDKNEAEAFGADYAEDFEELAKEALGSGMPPISKEIKFH